MALRHVDREGRPSHVLGAPTPASVSSFDDDPPLSRGLAPVDPDPIAVADNPQPSDGAPSPQFDPVVRADGVTSAERYLQRLCERSFLRLWSYPGVYRDQGGGKEIADVLVVFGKHIIIFSDKSCVYHRTGKAELDWKRWFKKAVLSSAHQAWGAERWILDHPDRVFLDRACTVPFPILLPSRAEAVVHRIVVAHNVGQRCREALGGSGSLMLDPSLGDSDSALFTVGDLDRRRGFVHVFDDHTVEVALRTFDTAPDFLEYLQAKERLVRSGALGAAAGEEELMALFLTHGTADGHDFPSVAAGAALYVDEGHWADFQASARRRTQIVANQGSYLWDELIRQFEKHFLHGTSEYRSHDHVRDLEPILRYMASEDRTRRRHLSAELVGLLSRPRNPAGRPNVRVIASKNGQTPCYVFLAHEQQAGTSPEDYRAKRREFLRAYMLVARLLRPGTEAFVGIATEPASAGDNRSEDAMLLLSSEWTAEMQEMATLLHEKAGLLKRVTEWETRVVEYPDPVPRRDTPTAVVARPSVRAPGRLRNAPCPCQSGKKYKRCCGA